MHSAMYLYGFTRLDRALPAGLRGVEGAPVRPITIGGLAAVVGEVPSTSFQSETISDPTWLIPRVLEHERVIEAMRTAGPVMPVRFGSLFSTPRALEQWAAGNLGPIDEFLDRSADRDEWTFRLSVDLGKATEALAAVDPRWAAMVEALPRSPGARYLREKKLAESARTETIRRASAIAEDVRLAARRLADERLLPLRKPDEAGVEPILNAAYLVARHEAGTLRRTVESTAEGLPCLRLESSGPWAPAHFCPTLAAPGR